MDDLEAILQVVSFLALGEIAGFTAFFSLIGFTGYQENRKLAKEMMPHYEAGRLPEKPTAFNVDRLLRSDPEAYRNILIADLYSNK